mgnify:CR=1 FL=1
MKKKATAAIVTVVTAFLLGIYLIVTNANVIHLL